MVQPHPDSSKTAIACAVLTISDTRTPESDRSGTLLQDQLVAAGHRIPAYTLLPDEPQRIRQQVQQWAKQDDITVILTNGGTGIAPRDTSYDAIAPLLEKTLPGFGEIFRFLSYQEIGSRAIASRATAGVYNKTLIFVLPGSSNAVKLALEQLILPELHHLTRQLVPPS
ncbi:MogA/MoaB family molybdenum cofactor biosynthesis protein [Spirulina sp. CS-785/01]|uniref:MogA/MoaB family molybdenum cofactor biosynthesis protein n=1 Tax=Spirulina sp. CS-785/01 TaxID=3021716 RepID=UPI00232B4601|nr:MogA/MoaB family molybdenum cofactor biosynthesis protein [Spirulina sp. CS-785/01]MDB9313473.1 MogA/MoaB family molybdenum cofactor biosynthesis protein [Spirulina sp. CS-785/01]